MGLEGFRVFFRLRAKRVQGNGHFHRKAAKLRALGMIHLPCMITSPEYNVL